MDRAALNSVALGSGSSGSSLVHGAISQVFTLTGSLTAALTHHAVVSGTLSLEGVVVATRKLHAQIAGTVGVNAVVTARRLRHVYAAITALLRLDYSLAWHRRIVGSGLGVLALSGATTSRVLRLRTGTLAGAVALSGEVFGSDIPTGPAPSERTADVPFLARAIDIEGRT